MKSREILRNLAEAKLAVMVEEAQQSLAKHSEVSAVDLSTLAFGKKTATLHKKVIKSMIDDMEATMAKKFNDQLELIDG